jgi:cobalt-zinc-cadmium efflux system membrane fusion protein
MRFFLIIPLSVIFFLQSCGGKKQESETTAQPIVENEVSLNEIQIKNASIETGKLEKQSIHTQIKLNGTVDIPPQNIVSVSFPMGGYLKSTRLIPGMNVKKGEVIAVLEDPGLVQLQQDYLMAKVKQELNRLEFQRQSTLREGNVNAVKTYQQAQAEFESQKVLVKGLEEKLKLAGLDPLKLDASNISRSVPLRSPINGFVSKVNVNIGKYVNPSDVLFELINPEDVHAALTVFEKDLPQVKTGQRVKVSFVNEPEKKYDCEVILVTQNVSEEGSSTMHCHFISKPARLVPGMFLTANLIGEGKDGLTVPEEGVVRSGNQLMVVEELTKGKYRLVNVKEGERENGRVEIISDEISLEKNYVIKNAYVILSKLKNTSEE